RDAILPVQVRLATGAALVFLLASVLLLLEQAATAADVGLAAAVAPAIQMVSATQYGRVWIVREVLGVVLLVVLALCGRPSRPVAPPTLDRLALLPGLWLLAAISLVSHSDASGLASPIGVLPIGLATDVVHLVATAIWVGGLLQLVVLVPALSFLGPPAR